MLHSHIHEYGHGHVQNGHRMFITIEHRNLEIRKHVTTSCSGTKLFYWLWVKGFDVRRRDTIFYAVLFIWPPSRAAPIGRTFASRLRAPKVDRLRPVSNLNSLFLQIFTQTSACFRCVTSPAPRHPFCLWVLWHLSDTSIRSCAPALTPASMLHPTNPCAAPKGSQLN